MKRNKFPSLLGLLLLLALAIGPVSRGKEQTSPAKKAELKVEGLGWLTNRNQRLVLERLLGDERGATLDANAIEDAALLLLSALENEGYLKVTLATDIVTSEGAEEHVNFDLTLANTLPRPLHARSVRFRAIKGIRYVVKEVRIEGVSAVPLQTARGYFRPDSALFGGAARAYTPSRLRRAAEQLQEELRQHGYADADVRAAAAHIDDATGAVDVVVDVKEGARWEVTELRVAGAEDAKVALQDLGRFEKQPWAGLWQQNVREAIRQSFYRRGYPDVTVQLSPQSEATEGGVKRVVVTAKITPGPQVRVGEVRFKGNVQTKESVLRRRVAGAGGRPIESFEPGAGPVSHFAPRCFRQRRASLRAGDGRRARSGLHFAGDAALGNEPAVRLWEL